MSPERGPSTASQSEQSDGVKKRIKIVITKQQLQQLLSKSLSVEEVLAGSEKELPRAVVLILLETGGLGLILSPKVMIDVSALFWFLPLLLVT